MNKVPEDPIDPEEAHKPDRHAEGSNRQEEAAWTATELACGSEGPDCAVEDTREPHGLAFHSSNTALGELADPAAVAALQSSWPAAAGGNQRPSAIQNRVCGNEASAFHRYPRAIP